MKRVHKFDPEKKDERSSAAESPSGLTVESKSRRISKPRGRKASSGGSETSGRSRTTPIVSAASRQVPIKMEVSRADRRREQQQMLASQWNDGKRELSQQFQRMQAPQDLQYFQRNLATFENTLQQQEY